MNKKKTIYQKYFKRALDVILSILGIIILSPILLVVYIISYIKLGSPVVFSQPRPGKGEKIFNLYKFRSMTNETDESGKLLPDSQRLTKYGKFLRKSSIDELLELFNIVKGDMSIVGPRPLSIYYLQHYPKEFKRRHEVRPGLTGLAQVNGRNNLQWEDRFKYDIQYVDNLSFLGDLKIIMKTVKKVLKSSDIGVRGKTKVIDYGTHSIINEEGKKNMIKEGMTYSEIGSYFWGEQYIGGEGINNWLPPVDYSTFTFSGRAAISLALDDILSNHRINKIYAPSYGCVSMIQSFVDRGMKVNYYDVEFADGKFVLDVPNADSNTLVLVMSYFGLDNSQVNNSINSLHEQGAIIIEDITHSLLRNNNCSSDSDYLIASLRKWFGIPTGGWVGKKRGELSKKPNILSYDAVADRKNAMRLKKEYIENRIEEKEEFLKLNATFDNHLIHIDYMAKLDESSLQALNELDVNSIIGKRKENANELLEGLKEFGCEEITLPDINAGSDVLLFLPIFLENEKRDSLRKYLIDHGVYCPVHWPEIMGASVGIRENELSLICDQRYSKSDMRYIVECIKDWSRSAPGKE